jgi:hypothetical protein
VKEEDTATSTLSPQQLYISYNDEDASSVASLTMKTMNNGVFIVTAVETSNLTYENHGY